METDALKKVMEWLAAMQVQVTKGLRHKKMWKSRLVWQMAMFCEVMSGC